MQKLSTALEKIKKQDTFAKCPGCGSFYIDDIKMYGTILSPCCRGFCLIRGFTKKEMEKIAG